MHFAKMANHPFDLVVYNVLATNNFAIGKFPTCKKTTRREPARFATRWISIYYRNTWFPTEQYNACLEPVCFVIKWSVYCEITWFQTGQQNARWEPLSCGAQMIDSLFVLEKRCPCNGESYYRKTLNVMLLCATLHAERHYFVTIVGDRMSPTCRTQPAGHTILNASKNRKSPSVWTQPVEQTQEELIGR